VSLALDSRQLSKRFLLRHNPAQLGPRGFHERLFVPDLDDLGDLPHLQRQIE